MEYVVKPQLIRRVTSASLLLHHLELKEDKRKGKKRKIKKIFVYTMAKEVREFFGEEG